MSGSPEHPVACGGRSIRPLADVRIRCVAATLRLAPLSRGRQREGASCEWRGLLAMDTLKQLTTRTRVEGLVIMLVAAGYLWEANNVPEFYQLPDAPGPTTFPYLLGIVFALVGLWLLDFSHRPDRPPSSSRRQRGAGGCAHAARRARLAAPPRHRLAFLHHVGGRPLLSLAHAHSRLPAGDIRAAGRLRRICWVNRAGTSSWVSPSW